ncbi:2-oxoacid:acceptor oxidoreductase subunit alpha [Candidatus Colwellia aromaticivorans]|uniref:2-oxoacid:acceptor oxidoreductase subunit alpha n=1 Tax=Candidatus Colwellia aromaticivorans TaxID=2267621 RepID=UPI000DF4B41F|nr:2-oxoacid:acceptor oxidoreductase subunit alpha [Candidatus Colwellia aromaticivorans]
MTDNLAISDDKTSSQQIINEFVVRFANTNGTGSASANNMFAKAISRMGIPVSAKNIFPSNIQGMPTWYEVRISQKNYLGRRGGKAEMIVAMNAQSLNDDINTVKTGGYILYDSSRALSDNQIRSDINYLGMPISNICLKEYRDPRQRQLFKNVIYVGALAALLCMDFALLKALVRDQFKGKEKLITPNIYALELGYQYANEHFICPLAIKVESRDLIDNRILVDGNTAVGLGAVYGGATVVGWYPITPSTSVIEKFSSYCHRLRIDPASGKKNYAIIQVEDELAAIGVAIGAGWNGARAFTATSGPGVSLMTEFLGLAYFTEVPMVLVNVQRSGPSTGMPTRTQQSDILACAYASHGDTKQILLFPHSPTECFDFSAQAFDIAEQLQTPVIIMSDLDLGMNEHLSEAFSWQDDKRYDQGKVLTAEQLDEVEVFGRYLDVDDDGICYRTLPGTHPEKGAFFNRGTSRNRFAGYTEKSADYVDNMERLTKKFNSAIKFLPEPEIQQGKKTAPLALIYFGTSSHPIAEAIDQLQEQGLATDTLRIKAFPFHQQIEQFIDEHCLKNKQVFVIEQNRDAQMKSLLVNELQIDPNKLTSILNFDGLPITSDFIVQTVLAQLASPQLNKKVG